MVRHLATFALFIALAGCSSSETSTPSPAPSPAPTNTSDGTEPPAAGEDPSGNASPEAPVAPTLKAPKLDKVAKMMGALHVMWTNADETCESIVAERKTASTDYVVAFTVPGEADNKHDTAAKEATTYTYRLRCKKGATFSPYSNEKSGSPN